MLTRLVMASQIKYARWAFNCSTWSPSEKDWQLLASGISAEDKEEVGKFVFKKDAKSAMIGRYLIKKFVSEATGLEWQDIVILRDSEHKKPYFPHDSRVKFNISHSGDFVVLAGEMSTNIHLGIDLMKIESQRTTSVSEFFRLMAKQFAPQEWDVVKSQQTEPEQMAMFYRFWCLKESFTKATGTGITVDLQKIRFQLKNLNLSENIIVDDTEVYVEGKKLFHWKFEESLINKDHIVTVAINSVGDYQSPVVPSKECLFTHLTFSDVTSHLRQISQLDEEYSKKFMAKKLRP